MAIKDNFEIYVNAERTAVVYLSKRKINTDIFQILHVVRGDYGYLHPKDVSSQLYLKVRCLLIDFVFIGFSITVDICGFRSFSPESFGVKATGLDDWNIRANINL